jgi:hypothetical protein
MRHRTEHAVERVILNRHWLLLAYLGKISTHGAVEKH